MAAVGAELEQMAHKSLAAPILVAVVVHPRAGAVQAQALQAVQES
jgi:hypothetical protein